MVLITVLCAPLMVLLAPLLARHGRGWYRHPAVPTLVAGYVVQAAYVYVVAAPRSDLRTARAPGLRLDMLERGAALAVDGALAHRVAVAVGALLVVLAILTVARVRGLPTLLLISAALAGTVPTVTTGAATGRYTALATTLLVTAAVVAVRERPAGVLPVATGVVFAGAALVGFSVSPHRASGPSWLGHVRQARPTCDAIGRAFVPVVPSYFPQADVHC